MEDIEIPFVELPLHQEIQKGLQEANFQKCTPIQAKVLPLSLKGTDIVGKAHTGTGKTAAFLITTFQLLLSKPRPKPKHSHCAHPRAVVLAPTRELALQIQQDANLLGKYTGLGSVVIFGGVEYEKQLKELSMNPEMVVATPGRLIDHFKNRKISFRNVEVFIIDEADRMFDMGFYPDLKYLMYKMPRYDQRVTLLFSATMSYRVTELSYEFMNNAVEIDVSEDQMVQANVEQEVFHVGMDEKIPFILGLLKKEDSSRVIIFCNTKAEIDRLVFKLNGNGFHAHGLSGDLPQKKRLGIIRSFKEGKSNIIVATDVASRGLHVDDISLVINYDVPEDPENYVHRIGRTARAGQSGKAITLACEKFVYYLPQIEELIDFRIPVGSITDDDLIKDQSGRYHRKRPKKLSNPPSKQRRRRRGKHHGKKR